MKLHHVQVAIPPGGEDDARRFWVEGLGMAEVAKPEALRARGGLWVRAGEAEVHLGVEDPFRPARKAHPALLLDDVTALDAVAGRLAELGFEVDASQRETFPGHVRVHVFDGHGNRVELLARP
ncbi:VOC family protein [Nocardioides aestuarii]|uniref:VOC family protein n=1 Tax=Nocardioides aestuarii TaxID=252231 RepID=A0ABW4TRQ9_9ACTN